MITTTRKCKILIIVLSSLFIFSSCSPASEQGESDKINIKISWWGGESRHNATIKAIEAFEEKNPDINVDVQFGAWDGWEESMTTSFYAGTEADINQINWNWINEYSSDGSMFYDLNKLSEYFELSNYDENSLLQCTAAGELQAVPVSVTGRIFYWNKSVFDKAGIDVPDSLTKLYEAGRIMRERLGDDYYPLALAEYDRMLLMVHYLCSRYGKPWISDGSLNYSIAEITEGLEFIRSLEIGHVTPSISKIIGDGAVSLDKNPEWIEGRYAGIFEWDSSASKYASALGNDQEFIVGNYFEDFGVYKGGFSKISLAFAISEKTEHPVECAKLLDFLLNDSDGTAIMGVERGIPLSASAFKSCKDNGFLDGMAAEANKKVSEWSKFSFDINFEDPKLRVNPEGVYYEAFSGLSYGDYTSEEAAEIIYNSISEVLND